MTSTAIISAVSIGTGSNQGMVFNPVKTTLQAATTTVKIAARITFGDGSVRPSSNIRVRHAVSPTSYTDAATGAHALKQDGNGVEIPHAPNGGLDIERSSEVLITGAGYHYCWLEVPLLPIAATITVTLIELP